ncbi:hypothetical protein K378_00135 [Streptomyces sp. Amel2xB2]|uniref:RICIN domain-containing protein n=1 Tax=Streptomyces sp. Amel2xB2 TaxID=1305829 RepID=UPI000DBFD5AC|nr:RICIN domain-containing protein [Streptomyces sp. Amel2xB2]RAJ71317.1 hypothetical protein K378_00135 [Streptomyces sp. Amel2xB2]
MPLCRRLRALVAAGGAALVFTGVSASPAQAAPPTGRDVIISNYASNWYLSTDYQTVAHGQRTQIWDRDPMANNGAGSVWRISPRGDGTYSISPSEPFGAGSRYCLSDEKGTGEGEGAVWVRDCDSGDARQSWLIEETSSRSYVHTIVPAGHRDYALGPYRAQSASDTYVNVTRKFGRTPATAQMWKINYA